MFKHIVGWSARFSSFLMKWGDCQINVTAPNKDGDEITWLKDCT